MVNKSWFRTWYSCGVQTSFLSVTSKDDAKSRGRSDSHACSNSVELRKGKFDNSDITGNCEILIRDWFARVRTTEKQASS